MDLREKMYWPFYCEENIWHLCQQDHFEARSSSVVFISNYQKKCAFLNQKINPKQLIVWDYHVVFLHQGMIWDFDTILPFPISKQDYLAHSFPLLIESDYQPVFRLVDAIIYISEFYSDRSHMIKHDGEYQQPPPPWPPIRAELGSNLEEFVNMTNQLFGQVLNQNDFMIK